MLTAELYLTGFFPPDMTFPDPDTGPPPPPRSYRGAAATGSQQASGGQPGGSTPSGPGTHDATEVTPSYSGPGNRQGKRLFLNASAVLSVPGIICAGFGCLPGCGRGLPPGPWPMHAPEHLSLFFRWMWRLELARVVRLSLRLLGVAASSCSGSSLPYRCCP